MSSGYGWAARWRQDGVSGLGEGPPPGAARRLDAPGAARLEAVLAADPQAGGYRATGWTAALLQTELAPAGYVVGARTIRRTLPRLGYRWKRPQSVLGRPDPASAEKRGRDRRGGGHGRDAAIAAGITVRFLPLRSRELMPLEELWRGLKATIAANRCYASLEELTDRALAWLDAMPDAERHRRCGLQSSKYQWLPT